MNKELKQALNNLYGRASVHCPIEELPIILNDFKTLENGIKDTEKYKEALKILKEWFEVFEDENGWHLRTLFDIGRISKTKGKLLKEILKDE